MFAEGGDAETIVAAGGLARVDDDDAIETIVRDTLAQHPVPVEQIGRESDRRSGSWWDR